MTAPTLEERKEGFAAMLYLLETFANPPEGVRVLALTVHELAIIARALDDYGHGPASWTARCRELADRIREIAT